MRSRYRSTAQPSLFSLKCEVCGRELVPTGSGLYVACPRGHGRLALDVPPELFDGDQERCGSLFDTEE